MLQRVVLRERNREQRKRHLAVSLGVTQNSSHREQYEQRLRDREMENMCSRKGAKCDCHKLCERTKEWLVDSNSLRSHCLEDN